MQEQPKRSGASLSRLATLNGETPELVHLAVRPRESFEFHFASQSPVTPLHHHKPLAHSAFSPPPSPKKNEAPCGLLFRAALQLHFFVCVSYLSSLFQAFPSYPPCRWAELTLD